MIHVSKGLVFSDHIVVLTNNSYSGASQALIMVISFLWESGDRSWQTDETSGCSFATLTQSHLISL